MRDLVPTIQTWLNDGRRVALATVTATRRSTPRPTGTSMAVNDAGEVAGNVSAGCVDGDVHRVAMEVVADGTPRTAAYGISDDTAWSVGLMCGGELEVLVTEIVSGDPLLTSSTGGQPDHPAAVVTIVGADDPALTGRRLVITLQESSEPTVHGSTGHEQFDQSLTADALAMLEQGRSGLRHYGSAGERLGEAVTALVVSFAPPSRLYVFGAIDFAAALAEAGRFVGFHVTVCDPRTTFATPGRFPGAHQVVHEWPHRFLDHAPIDAGTAICVLTHDPKFDIPALTAALRSPAGYVGAMGSRRTDLQRRKRLVEEGVTATQLRRLRSPIGLDLGGRSPEETAISIVAEILRDRHHASGGSLSTMDGPLH